MKRYHKHTILLFALIVVSKCNFLKELENISIEPEQSNPDYYSNSLIPGRDSIEKLKQIIKTLVVKLDDMSLQKENTPHFKYCKIFIN